MLTTIRRALAILTGTAATLMVTLTPVAVTTSEVLARGAFNHSEPFTRN